MKDNQRISKYLVWFNSLAVRSPWGEAALRYRFYDGLPPRLKDGISKGDGKPQSLAGLRDKAMSIDARYWERQQERSREQNQAQCSQQSKQSTQSTSTPSTSSTTPGTLSRTSDQASPKSKGTTKPATPKPDLSGKLDSKGKLTQQERQYHMDKNLCLYCGKPGHRTSDCSLTGASSAKG